MLSDPRPDKMAYGAGFHQGLRFLQKYPFRGFWSIKVSVSAQYLESKWIDLSFLYILSPSSNFNASQKVKLRAYKSYAFMNILRANG